MAQKLKERELVSFKELLMANSIEVDTVTSMCIELGIFTEEEFHKKLQEVQADHLKNE